MCEGPTAAAGMASAKCTACDEGKVLTGSGYGCVTCDIAGCTTCSTGSSGETCLTCADSEKFIAANKKSCKAACDTSGGEVVDSAAVGPDSRPIKACKCDAEKGYQLQGDGTCKKQSDNTNKSALSTGAIAGISVAAVVVVGGLVGFLCWWFICRGKA